MTDEDINAIEGAKDILLRICCYYTNPDVGDEIGTLAYSGITAGLNDIAVDFGVCPQLLSFSELALVVYEAHRCWDGRPSSPSKLPNIGQDTSEVAADSAPLFTGESTDAKVASPDQMTEKAVPRALEILISFLNGVCAAITNKRSKQNPSCEAMTMSELLELMDIGEERLSEALSSRGLLPLTPEAPKWAPQLNEADTLVDPPPVREEDSAIEAAIEAYRVACATNNCPVQRRIVQQMVAPIVSLDASGCSITDPGAHALAELLSYLPNLESLDLADNNIGGDGHVALGGVIRKMSRLTALNYSSNPMGSLGAKAVSGVMRNHPSLRSLNLGKTKIGDFGIERVCDGLKTCSTLTSLNLEGNSAADRACYALSEMLEENTSLLSLDLRWNQIRTTGAVTLCSGLRSNQSLKKLVLDWNGFGDRAPCGALKAAMQEGGLHHISLRQCRVSDIGASLIAEAAKNTTSLKEINLDGNPLGRVGGRAILKVSTGGELEQTVDRPKVTFTNCNVGRVDPHAFDPSDPAGKYEFNIADEYSRTVMRNLILMTFQKRGEFVKGSIKLNGQLWNGLKITDDLDGIKFPDSGQLEFEFKVIPMAASADQKISSGEVAVSPRLILGILIICFR